MSETWEDHKGVLYRFLDCQTIETDVIHAAVRECLRRAEAAVSREAEGAGAAELHDYGVSGDATGHYGTCTCGWRGRYRADFYDAEDDAANHGAPLNRAAHVAATTGAASGEAADYDPGASVVDALDAYLNAQRRHWNGGNSDDDERAALVSALNAALVERAER